MSTEDVLNRHLEAFGSLDLEGIMADYAEDAFILTNTDDYHGLDEIERFFIDLFDEFSQPGTDVELDQQTVEGEYAYIVWHAETPDNDYEFATDTFVIQDGEIVAQTLGTKVEPKV